VAFCWGYTNWGTGATSDWPNVVSMSNGWKAVTEFSNTLYSLISGSSYVYRCYATNTTGAVWSVLQRGFTTLTVVPTVNNADGASNITENAATLNGNLSLQFGTAAITVYWGEEDGGTNKASWDNPGSLGARSQGAFSTNITGLTVDTLYYYRTYASNTYGDAWASETSLWMAQTRTTGAWHLVSVPVNYTNKCLHSVLGRAIASGMTAGTLPTDDSLWLQGSGGSWTGWHWLTSSTNWRENASNMASSNEVQLGIAFWLKRSANGPDPDIAAFVGTQPTNSAQMTFSNESWWAFGWPYASKLATAGSGTTNIGWGFAAQGGTRGNSGNNSDMIMAEYNGKWHQIYLGVNSNWYERGTRTITSIELKPGKGYFYYRRGGSTMYWTAPRY
jgi:hypothetical protein